MNWKIWTWPKQMRELRAEAEHQKGKQEYMSRENERLEKLIESDQAPKLILHGFDEGQIRRAFLTAPDSEWHKGVLEQCDLSLMEAVNELVNKADDLSDAQLRQRVGELRGITELRERFEQHETQARKDHEAIAQPEREQGEE